MKPGELAEDGSNLLDRARQRSEELGLEFPNDTDAVLEAALSCYLEELNEQMGEKSSRLARIQQVVLDFYGEDTIHELAQEVLRKRSTSESVKTARNEYITVANTVDALARIQINADRGDALPPGCAPPPSMVTEDGKTVAARVPMLLREPGPVEMRYDPPVRETVDILQERYTPHEFDRTVYSDQDIAIGGPVETYLVLKTDRTRNNHFEDDHVFVPSGDPPVVGD